MSECEWTSTRIGEIISLDVESDQQISSYPNIPSEFFEDMESSWKGRIKRIHLEEAFEEVEKAAAALSLAVSLQDFCFLRVYTDICSTLLIMCSDYFMLLSWLFYADYTCSCECICIFSWLGDLVFMLLLSSFFFISLLDSSLYLWIFASFVSLFRQQCLIYHFTRILVFGSSGG